MTRPKPAKSEKAEKSVPEKSAPTDAVPIKAVSTNTRAAPAKAAPAPASPVAVRPPGSAPHQRASRWALLLLVFVLGTAVGTFGSLGHRSTATWLGVSWPTGLALCLGGLVGLLLGIGELLDAGAADSWRPTRLSALGWASAGWLLALLWLTYLGPPPALARKGDVVLADDWKSLAFLLGGMLLVTVAVFRAWAASLTARLAARPGAPGSVHPKG